jgi:hypothetical protein
MLVRRNWSASVTDLQRDNRDDRKREQKQPEQNKESIHRGPDPMTGGACYQAKVETEAPGDGRIGRIRGRGPRKQQSLQSQPMPISTSQDR